VLSCIRAAGAELRAGDVVLIPVGDAGPVDQAFQIEDEPERQPEQEQKTSRKKKQNQEVKETEKESRAKIKEQNQLKEKENQLRAKEKNEIAHNFNSEIAKQDLAGATTILLEALKSKKANQTL